MIFNDLRKVESKFLKQMKKGILICIIMVSCCLIVACQPTPEEEIIIGKGNSDLIDKINESTNSPITSDSTNNTDRWKDNFVSNDGLVKFIVDAEINLPDVNQYPVLRVEPTDFTADQIETAAKVLFDGAQIYNGSNVYTKSMINEIIIEKEQKLSYYQANNNDGGFDYIIDEIENSIEYYNNLYQTAPDELPKNPPVYDFNEDGMINLYTDMDGHDIRYISVSDLGRYSKLEYTTDREYTIIDEPVEIGTTISSDINFSDAKTIADQYLHDMGINYMDLSFMCIGKRLVSDITSDEYVYESYDDDQSGEPNYNNSVEPCYVFYYTRSIKGVLTTYVNKHNGTSTYGTDGDQIYREPWEQEYIEIFIDKDGISCLTWHCPTTIIGFESENVPILSIEEAKESAKRNMEIIYNEFIPIKDISVNMYITNIKLGMTRIAVEGEEKSYIFIPTWDFFGYFEYTKPSGTQFVSEKMAYTLLTINAIDGSIIDRGLEY